MVVAVVVVAVVVVVVVLVLFLRGGGVRVVAVGVDVAAVVVVAVEVVVWGTGGSPPLANTFITGSGLLKTSLHGVKKAGALGRVRPPPICKPLICKQTAGSMMTYKNAITTTCLRQFLLMVRFCQPAWC